MLKFERAIKANGTKPEEVFRACDSQGSGKITPQSIEQFVEDTLRTEFKYREKYALGSYMDTTKTGSIDRKSFMNIMEKAREINADPAQSKIALNLNERSTLPAPPVAPVFIADGPAAGDQAAGITAKAQPVKKGPTVAVGADLETVQSAIDKIQKQAPFGRFLLELLNACEPSTGGVIALEDVNRFLSAR